MADFFDNQDEDKEVEKLKIGDQEFTTEELQELVGAGRKLKELEEKQGQPVENIVSDWGKRGETLGAERKAKEEALAELEKYKNPPTKEQVDQETLRKQVLEELKGYGIATKEEIQSMINEVYQTNRTGEKILSQVKKVVRQARDEGRPETNEEELLEFMRDKNLGDPEIAYKIKFDKELDDWKQAQLSKAKGTPIMTDTKSTAGAKQFEGKTPHSKAELKSALTSILYGEGGAQ